MYRSHTHHGRWTILARSHLVLFALAAPLRALALTSASPYVVHSRAHHVPLAADSTLNANPTVYRSTVRRRTDRIDFFYGDATEEPIDELEVFGACAGSNVDRTSEPRAFVSAVLALCDVWSVGGMVCAGLLTTTAERMLRVSASRRADPALERP